MGDSGSGQSPLKVLLVFRNETVRGLLQSKIESYYPGQVQIDAFSSISDAIEKIETSRETYPLALLEHEGQGVVLLKALLGLLSGPVIGVFSVNPDAIAGFAEGDRSPEILDASDPESSLYRLLKKASALGRIPLPEFREEEQFVAIGMESLSSLTPLASDVYSRIRKDHYVCVFKKGSIVEVEDLKKFIDSKRTGFYVRASGIKDSLTGVAARIEEISKTDEVTPERAQKEFVSAHSLLKEVTGQLGFTPEAQAVAKSCVRVALQALGSKPKLSVILEELRGKEGPYIPAHSFMVGNVACALAHRIGWSSSATFFKLSLAAFLHDIALDSMIHAKLRNLSMAHQAGLENEEIRIIKLHPVEASEYSKQFAEIPSDVDIIISQHHESPGGDGFPRGMPGKLISPLSALFIMAQDLVDEVMEKPGTRFEDFFSANADRYEVGQFRKIKNLILNPR
jgi:response regulator RpfG family c-di-GMP phosphodiesterase